MSEINDALKILQRGILMTVDKKLDQAPYDKTVKGRVFEVLPDNRFVVVIDGIHYIIKSKNVYSINDVVYVLILQNNYNEMLILQ